MWVGIWTCGGSEKLATCNQDAQSIICDPHTPTTFSLTSVAHLLFRFRVEAGSHHICFFCGALALMLRFKQSPRWRRCLQSYNCRRGCLFVTSVYWSRFLLKFISGTSTQIYKIRVGPVSHHLSAGHGLVCHLPSLVLAQQLVLVVAKWFSKAAKGWLGWCTVLLSSIFSHRRSHCHDLGLAQVASLLNAGQFARHVAQVHNMATTAHEGLGSQASPSHFLARSDGIAKTEQAAWWTQQGALLENGRMCSSKRWVGKPRKQAWEMPISTKELWSWLV